MDLKLLESKLDDRGLFVEAFKLPNDGQISYVLIEPDKMRGNHYHERKTEYFLIMDGTATISAKDRDTDSIMNVEVSGQHPMVVKIIPNHTHNITAGSGGCALLLWCDEQFNENDPDTFMEEL